MSDESETFDLVIDFDSATGDPARVFRAMSGLIDSIQQIDRHLAESIDASLETRLLLDDVERGSLKARFRGFVEGISDEALKDGDWRKLVGHFLLRSKKKILEWCHERDEIADRDSVKQLEGELMQIAEETNVKMLPAYSAIPAERLLSDIRNLQDSLGPLSEGDSASYQYGNERVDFNKDLQISNEVVREVLTREVITTSSKRVLLVKKPDYIGKSMWSFMYDGRAIEAKIADQDWLTRFQLRDVDVKPGDSVSVMLLEEISYGYEGEVVHRHYEIEKVYEVLRPPRQSGLHF